MAKDIIPVNMWKNIERCWVLRLDLVYEGKTIVGIHNFDTKNAIIEIDTICKKLQEYKHELELFYNIEPTPKTKTRFYTYVYILFDERTCYYKIGKSINPLFREKTISSEIPSVKMIFISPLTNPETEKELHKIFNKKRIRGEWFKLNQDDINFIRNFKYGTA